MLVVENRMLCIVKSVIIFLVVVVSIMIWMHEVEYTDYWAVTGSEYEQIIRERGTPEDIVQKKMYDELHYKNLTYICEGKNHDSVSLVMIEDESMRFGIFKIGIGSSRSLIESVYLFKKKMISDNDNILGVVDGITVVSFEFEDDRVKKIFISLFGA